MSDERTLGMIDDELQRKMLEDSKHLQDELFATVRMFTAEQAALRMHQAPGDRKGSDYLRALQRQGSIFGFVWAGKDYYPAYQFDSGGPKPVIAKLVQILSPRFSGYEIALWFAATNDWLDGATPTDLLDVQPELLVDAAEQRVLKASY